MESATSSARGHTISLLPEPRPLPSPGFPQTPEGHSHPWEASILGPSSPFVPAVVSEQDRVPSSEQLSACPQEPSWRLAARGQECWPPEALAGPGSDGTAIVTCVLTMAEGSSPRPCCRAACQARRPAGDPLKMPLRHVRCLLWAECALAPDHRRVAPHPGLADVNLLGSGNAALRG